MLQDRQQVHLAVSLGAFLGGQAGVGRQRELRVVLRSGVHEPSVARRVVVQVDRRAAGVAQHRPAQVGYDQVYLCVVVTQFGRLQIVDLSAKG